MKIIGFGLDPKNVYSTKYRLEKYKKLFSQNGIKLVVKPTLQISKFEPVYSINKTLGNLAYYGIHLFDILISVIESSTYDAVFVQRHVFPGKVSFLEKLLVRCNKNIIFDFDDAIFTIPKHFRYKNWKTDPNALNEFNKVILLIKASKLVIAGNEYLQKYAQKYNSNVIIVPTPIDTELFKHPKIKYNTHNPISIGWYGSWGNQPYLETIMPAIKKLSKEYPIELVVISDKDYFKKYNFIRNVRWNEETEEKQLTELDVAIAPLPIDEWTRGKCGYKILKYMICGIPCVVTPIEIQKEIINHGHDGYHAMTLTEWHDNIQKLIKSKDLRIEFGKISREKVIKFYSREWLGAIIIKNIQSILRNKD